MNKHAKWISTAAAVAGGLAAGHSAQAQDATGSDTLNNLVPADVTLYAAWGNSDITSITYGGAGLTITSTGYGSLYYAASAAGQAPTLNAADTQASLTFTISGPAGSYYVGVPFILNDNNPNGPQTYPEYGTYGPGTYTETVPLTASQQATVSAGGDTLYGFNLEFDPTGNLPNGGGQGPYTITFDSLSLSSVPEPGTMQLLGLGAAGFLTYWRRKK